MAFYRSQKLSAIAVYSRLDGSFMGMVRLVALETPSQRVERSQFENSTAPALIPAQFEIRWYDAADFDCHPLQYTQARKELPAFLSPTFNNFTVNTINELVITSANTEHVLMECNPWLKPAAKLEPDRLAIHLLKMPTKVA